jgi:hypothetical protein
MKKIMIFFCLVPCGLSALSQSGSVGIGTTSPNTSAALEIQSTTKGVLIPRMSTIQRNAISSPAPGLLVYDNTTNTFWFRNSTGWAELIDTSAGVWKRNGDSAYVETAVNVGIGTASPQYHLEIKKPNPSIGFIDAQSNQFSGFISGNDNDLNINASRGLLGQGGQGNLLLQTDALFAVSGNVGIGTTTPIYKLDVNGSARAQENLYVGNNATVTNNLAVHGTTNLFGQTHASENLSVFENLTVDNGKGILRSPNGNQLVVHFPSGTVTFSNPVPAGHVQDVVFALPNVFSAAPTISVANVTGQSGTFEQWTYTIHSIDIVAHSFTVRMFNAGSTSSTMSATVRFIAIGNAL